MRGMWNIALGVLLTIGVTGMTEAAQKKVISVQRNGIEVWAGSTDGFEVRVDGIPFLRKMTLYVVKPRWVGRYYGFEDDPELLSRVRLVEPQDGSAQIVLPIQSPIRAVQGQVQVEVFPDRRLKLSTNLDLTSNVQAFVEHQFGRIGAGWVMGRDYSAELRDGSTTHGVAPIVPRSSKIAESLIADRFRRLNLATPIGEVRMQATGDVRFVLIDYRLNPYADEDKSYWFGVLETPLPSQKKVSYSVEMQFPEPRTSTHSARLTTTTALKAAELALSPDAPPDLIIPTPKSLRWHDGTVPVGNTLTVSVKAPSSALESEIVALAKDSLDFWMTRAGISLTFDATPNTSPCLNLVLDPTLASAPHGQAPEFYRLDTTSSALRIEAPTTSGLWAGLRSFVQLMRSSENEASVRRCEIEDYASLPVRAIHFFSGKDARDLQVRMVREILGLLKINTLVYQCEYVKWDCLKEIHHPRYGMDKADAAAVRDEARRQRIEIIPLVNSFGHMEWLLDNDHYRHLADNPKKPYAYDPSNPRVYEICERIYSEVIDFFRPKTIHIGHDEITIGGFPQKPENKKVGATKLIVKDIRHYHNFLARRGIRTMIWGDLFLGPGEGVGACFAESVAEAKERRRGIPRDIIIADWHYDPAPIKEFVSLSIFNEEGFDTLACPWYRPDNVVLFAKAAALEYEKSHSKTKGDKNSSARRGQTLGVMQTTWAGYSFDEKSFHENPEQYSAYVLAAEAAWTGGYDSAAQVPFNYEQEFLRLWGASVFPNGSRGWFADLSPLANYRLPAGTGQDILDVPEWSSMKDFPKGEVHFGRFRFLIPSIGDRPAAVLLDGAFNPPGQWPKELVLDLNGRANLLAFAVAASLPLQNGTVIARTKVKYESGREASIDWKIGGTVFSLDDPRVGAETPVLWKNSESGKAPRVVHGYLWHNPYPNETIRSLVFESANSGSGLLIFGITGLQP